MNDSKRGGEWWPSQGHVIETPRDPDNAERVRWANDAINGLMQATGTPRDKALIDLLANLMHWSSAEGVDFLEALNRADQHYRAETRS